jgi:uncharacterized membrane protein HdeD (DUF308 family)
MDEAKLTSLRAYFESLSDEALLDEARLGQDAFAADAWVMLSEEIERRHLTLGHSDRDHSDSRDDAGAGQADIKSPSRVERLAARIDTLPPSIRPAAFGAMLVVMFAMARGASIILPIIVVYVRATSPDPWASLMTGVGIAVLAMIGGALSGFAYSLVGRHLRKAIPGGYYLTGIVTLAPYMFVLSYIVRLSDGVSLWHRPRGGEVAISGVLTLAFGIALGRAWFGEEKGARTEGAR